jgi:NAD(P)H-hydrate epimerase
MKILNANQIRALDAYTIQKEPIRSIDLMERAACQWTKKFLQLNPKPKRVSIFCGSGNNGGDGAAIARLLIEKRVRVHLILCHIGEFSPDLAQNVKRLENIKFPHLEITHFHKGDKLIQVEPADIIIDGLFGSGLNRPVSGAWGELIEDINNLPNKVFSIDIPSGLHPDKHIEGSIIDANTTITFELPKLAFMCPENAKSVGHLEIVSIGLHTEFLDNFDTPYSLITEIDAQKLHRNRKKFDHKGVFGHGLLIVGSQGKMGAATLAGKGALRAGIGLLTMHVPKCGVNIIQTALPEAMVSIDSNAQFYSTPPDISPYRAIGVGSGLSVNKHTIDGLSKLLNSADSPLIIDADALNIISSHEHLLSLLPPGSILTPHFKEFERLFGPSKNHFERIEKARVNASKYQINILLKGAYSALATPDGEIFFNSTGNPGMATAGSGDVLTGMITGLLSQKYKPSHAAQLGMYIHGMAGDIAASKQGFESTLASDITENIGSAYLSFTTKA